MIVAKQGTSRYYLATWGTIVMVTPEQIRAASSDEIEMFDNIEELINIVGSDLQSVRQMGYVDERNAGPPDLRHPDV